MTPKEKAKELLKKFYNPIFDIDLGINVSKDKKRYESAKQCALIAVDEILNNNKILFEDVLNDYYWEEIKQETEKL